MTRMSEKKFAELVSERLIDTDQVAKLLGLESTQGVRHRIEHGWLSGPVLTREKGFWFWDKQQVEREEKARLAKIERVTAMVT
jgi:hypothetical protein